MSSCLGRSLLAVALAGLLAGLVVVRLAAQQQPPPTFKSGVEVVRIDVSIVDRTGQPVGNLAPGDFTVTVDGKPRTIVSAQFLNYETRTSTTTGDRVAPATTPARSSAPPSPPPPRIVLLVVDEDGIEPGEGQVAKQAAAKFLDRLAPNDRVGVATIPRLRSEVALSTRRSDVMKALDAVITGVNVDRYEYNVGIAEAFDIERGYADVAQKVVARECAGQAAPCPQDVMTQARQMALQAHLRGQRSLDALASLAEGLAAVEGPKTLVLISGGMPMPDLHSLAAFDRIEASFAAAQVSLYTLYLERSSFGQVKNKPSPTASDDDLLERDGIENAASVTGGTIMVGVGTLDQYFDRVVTELSGSYLLGVEVAPADRDGRTHWVDVRVSRRGVEVRARKRYLIDSPRPARAEPAASKGACSKAPKAAKGTTPAPITVEMMTPETVAAVGRAGAYAAAYESDLSGLVAEEKYVQRSLKYQKHMVTYATSARRGASGSMTQEEGEWVPDGERTLKSDFLLVKAHGSDRWTPFRDVFEVDGKAVREREQRLQQLFLKAPATAAERAAEINAESARFNIGFVERNVNLPTLALRLLDPARRSQLLFRKQGEATVAGVRTWELAFAERGSPTIVRDGNKDMPATGSFWIDPATGRVIRSTMRLKLEGVSVEVTVTYRPDPKAGGTWVPAEMREEYLGASRRLECVATYSNIRRFQVTTDEVQKQR
jgi:VWFA-related protein